MPVVCGATKHAKPSWLLLTTRICSWQADGWSNYGDGFTTDPAIIQKIRGYVSAKG